MLDNFIKNIARFSFEKIKFVIPTTECFLKKRTTVTVGIENMAKFTLSLVMIENVCIST